MNGCHRFGGTETGLQTAQVYFVRGEPFSLRHIAKIEGCMPEIDKELLEILMCLFCEGDLELKEDGSGLKCKNCKRVYPIRDGLPIMLKDQATIEA